MKIIRTERIRGLFSGNGVNCLRIVPFSGLVCLAYSTLAKVCVNAAAAMCSYILCTEVSTG